MKTKLLFRVTILMFLLTGFLFGCKKDSDLVGKLKVSFAYRSGDATILVYAIENTNYPIATFQTDIKGNGSTELNMGNYFIRVSSGVYYSSIGIQIRPKETTSVYWGADNQAYVQ